MKASVAHALVFLSALASASLLSYPPAPLDLSPRDIRTVAGTTGPDHLSIHFRAPCQGCFIGTDDGLELTLEIDSADEECSSSPPRLNGLPLALTRGRDVARGRISFKSKASNGLGEKVVHASWESSCLGGQASIVSVRFDDIAGPHQVTGASGFTTSFTQKGQPAVLRLQDKPIDHISSPAIRDEWLLPVDHKLAVIPVMSDPVTSVETMLQLEYLQLERLKMEMFEIHGRLVETECRIVSLLKEDFKACSSIKCFWQTAINKAPAFTKLITTHFSSPKTPTSGCEDGNAQKPCSTKGSDEVKVDIMTISPPPPSPQEVHADSADQAAPLPSPTPTRSVQFPPEEEQGQNKPASPPFESPKEDRPHRPHHPPPSFDGPDHDSFESHHGPPGGLPHHPPAGHHDPPPSFSDSSHRPHGLPGFRTFEHDARRRFEFRVGLAVVLLVLLIILTALIVRLVKQKVVSFRDPRRRAERAARREERRTRKLYRKAACKHKWTTWWKRYRRQCSNDYDEKRQMILEQEGVLEGVMQDEIRSLRLQNASDLVRNLVRAEEGRAGGDYDRAYHNGYHQAYSPASDAGVGSSRLSSVPPTYIAPPPRYEEEMEGEITVVDGFQYTPSNTDDTPESSIVDCSPRLSFETGRSTIFTKDARG